MSNNFRDRARSRISKEHARNAMNQRNMYVVEGGANNTVHYAKRGRPPKKNKGSSNIVFGFIVMLIILYIGGYLYSYVTRKKIPETHVNFGSIEPVAVFSGVIVRDETVYRSVESGIVVYYKSNFDKIRAGSAACSVQNEKEVKRLEETIANLESNMINAQENRSISSALENEKRNLDNQIIRLVDNLAFSVNSLDMQAMYKIVSDAEQIISHRNQLLFSENKGSIKDMTLSHALFQEQLNDAKKDVFVTNSGILSYKTDGLEEILTIDRLNVLSKEETLINIDYNDFYKPSEVMPGDSLFKLISSNDWYIAAYLPVQQTEGWTVGMTRTLYVDDGNDNFNELETRVETIARSGSEIYVVFKCRKNLVDFLDRRNVNFKIKKGLTEGLKIPNTAIADKTLLKIPEECIVTFDNGTKCVLRENKLKGGYEQVIITVFSTDNNYVNIISEFNNVLIGDKLLVRGSVDEIREVDLIENIKGVYVTNTGAAIFKRIILSGDVFENNQYTIIDPKLNPHIGVLDRIVTDINGIKENQLIY